MASLVCPDYPDDDFAFLANKLLKTKKFNSFTEKLSQSEKRGGLKRHIKLMIKSEQDLTLVYRLRGFLDLKKKKCFVNYKERFYFSRRDNKWIKTVKDFIIYSFDILIQEMTKKDFEDSYNSRFFMFPYQD